MKANLFFVTVFSLFLFSCKKSPTATLNQTVSTVSVQKFNGSFIGYGSEKVSGVAKIYTMNDKFMLQLENFSTTNGPDLKVYLSKAASPSAFISLGALQSTNGNQVYEIPGKPDFTQHRFVLIHCERYNHLYGSAELMP